jgi:hypothetical protein
MKHEIVADQISCIIVADQIYSLKYSTVNTVAKELIYEIVVVLQPLRIHGSPTILY